MKNLISFFIAVVILITSAIAQPGSIDLTFNPGTGANSSVYASAVQSDGKVIIGGQFTSFNGTTINRIARLNTDGTLDNTFDPGTGVDNTIYTISVQSDGKIIIGGDFTTVNGTGRNRIARLNSDGSLDVSFTIGSGASGIVYSTAIQSDGKIVIAGNFSGFNGTTRYYIARLNSDGSLDSGFTPGTSHNSYIQSIAIQTDGKIITAGNFTLFSGGSSNYIARLNTDGTADNSFDPGSGTNAIIYSAAIQPDGKIILGGNFTMLNGNTANYVTRLNSDGSADNSFNSAGSGANASVRTVSLEDNDQIVIGGSFTTYNGNSSNRIAVLNPDGAAYIGFNSGTGANNVVLTTVVQSTREIVAGGVFTSYNGTARNRIARINNQLITTTPFGPASYCEGTNLSVSYTAEGSFNPGNTFTAQLSDGSGSFSSAVNIGSVSSTTSGSIGATIPSSLSPGAGYRIRVVSNDPVVTGTDNENDIMINTLAVPQICLVTVDTPSTHNIIIWEKPITTQIDSFFIYREITSNNYTRVGAVHYDSLNEFHDFGADPMITSYRYKVSALDTCGFETDKSDYHSTIHLQNLGSGNLQWTLYEIENAGNPVTFYQVYRDDFGTNNFSALSTTIPGGNSTFTDGNFASFPNANYVVDVNWNISCTPFRTSINTTRSNLWISAPVVVIEENSDDLIKIYPNPASENLTMEIPETSKLSSVELMNSLGQVVYRTNEFSKNKNVTKHQIDVGNFAEGMYTLIVNSNSQRIVKKIVIYQF